MTKSNVVARSVCPCGQKFQKSSKISPSRRGNFMRVFLVFAQFQSIFAGLQLGTTNRTELDKIEKTLAEFCEAKDRKAREGCRTGRHSRVCHFLCYQKTNDCSAQLWDWSRVPESVRPTLKKKRQRWDMQLYKSGNPYGYIPSGPGIWSFEESTFSKWNDTRFSKDKFDTSKLYPSGDRDLRVHCIGCKDNTEGSLCQFCEPLYYNVYNKYREDRIHTFSGIWKVPVKCEPCRCHPEGSKSPVCQQVQADFKNKHGAWETRDVGSCDCREGYTGLRCDQCDAKAKVAMTRPITVVNPKDKQPMTFEEAKVTSGHNIRYPFQTWYYHNVLKLRPKTFDNWYQMPICVQAYCQIDDGTADPNGTLSYEDKNKRDEEKHKECRKGGDLGARCEKGNCKCNDNAPPRYFGNKCEYPWTKKDIEEEEKKNNLASRSLQSLSCLLLACIMYTFFTQLQ